MVQAAELEPDMAKWTPRARPKDAPKQSARYQTDFKALPEDVLECVIHTTWPLTLRSMTGGLHTAAA